MCEKPKCSPWETMPLPPRSGGNSRYARHNGAPMSSPLGRPDRSLILISRAREVKLKFPLYVLLKHGSMTIPAKGTIVILEQRGENTKARYNGLTFWVKPVTSIMDVVEEEAQRAADSESHRRRDTVKGYFVAAAARTSNTRRRGRLGERSEGTRYFLPVFAQPCPRQRF